MIDSVVCCGMTRSASTWLYNVVLQFRPELSGLYCESGMDLPEDMSGLLIKCHGPDDAMIDRIRDHGIAVLLTVRDPRDALVSFMECFNAPFQAAADVLPLCAGPILKLTTYAELILQYEDGFSEDLRSVEAIAGVVGNLSGLSPREVLVRMGRERIREDIARLERVFFDSSRGPEQFEPRSHWHPKHVGDGLVGKYAERLRPEQEKEVLNRTREYCECFGYI